MHTQRLRVKGDPLKTAYADQVWTWDDQALEAEAWYFEDKFCTR